MWPVKSRAPMMIMIEPVRNMTRAIEMALMGIGGSFCLNYFVRNFTNSFITIVQI